MSYAIKLHPQVAKFLERSERELAERIRRKLLIVSKDPFLYLEHFEGQDFFKLRVGSYRMLIDVDEQGKSMLVRYINHRSKVYKRFRAA